MLTHGSVTAVECPSDTRAIQSSARREEGQIEPQISASPLLLACLQEAGEEDAGSPLALSQMRKSIISY